MSEQRKLGSYLKLYRERANLTQAEVANLVSVQTQTIWRWEHDEREPSLEIIQRLAEILHCTEAELFNGPDDGRIRVTLSYNWEEFKKGEINMDKNDFKLILGGDGKVGLQGAGMLTSREAIGEFLAAIKSELEIAFDTQVRRGVIQEA